MRDYSVYHITPPNLFVIAEGPEIYMTGFSDDEREKICEIFENLIYDNEISFYYNDDYITDENIGWIEYVIMKSNFIIVNINNITPLEQYIIESTSYDNKGIKGIIYYSDNGLTPYCRILAKHGETVIFNIRDLEDLLKTLIENDEETFDDEE